MKLSISNIAWNKECNNIIYKFMQDNGFEGLEIAPTQLIGAMPYDNTIKAKDIVFNLKKEFNLEISSMQSIWHGKSERIFFSEKERNILVDYTKKAIDFATNINCRNLVFGSPRNRIIQSDKQYAIAIDFFKQIGEYAKKNNTYIALEANPVIYNTNFINTHKEAFEFVKDVNSEGLKINFDFGTLIANKEDIYDIKNYFECINHIHISEPYLNEIEQRKEHKILSSILKEQNYNKYISIEMKNLNDIQKVKDILLYVKNIFYM